MSTLPIHTLKLGEFDAFGFDLDHTFARYKLPAQQRVCFDSVGRYAVDTLGYAASVTDVDNDFFKNFTRRGLLLDFETRCLIKVKASGKIVRGSRGTKMLSEAELRSLFGEDLMYPEDKLNNVLETGSGVGQARLVGDNFYTPTMGVHAKMLDVAIESHDTFFDVIQGAKDSFSPEQFKAKKGHYFPEMVRKPGNYIYDTSQEMKDFLKRLRKSGKVVFLVTNSQVDYACHVLDNCLHEDWRSYLDFLICDARKPTFFTKDEPFAKWCSDIEKCTQTEKLLQRSQIYTQGSSQGLIGSLESLLGRQNLKIAFFGDSISSDLVPAWNAECFYPIAVMEEVETEIVSSSPTGQAEPDSKRQKLVDSLYYSFAHTPPWGSVFAEGGEKTLFSRVVEENCHLIIPSIDVLTGISLDQPINASLSADNEKKNNGHKYYPHPPAVMQGGSWDLCN